jgi:predicted ArsR family transcriptional regulator
VLDRVGDIPDIDVHADLNATLLEPEGDELASVEVAAERGFEPDRESPGCLRLRNCPFHPLTARAPDLVCGLNHAFVSGMVDGLQALTVDAVLDPRAGESCVELRARP